MGTLRFTRTGLFAACALTLIAACGGRTPLDFESASGAPGHFNGLGGAINSAGGAQLGQGGSPNGAHGGVVQGQGGSVIALGQGGAPAQGGAPPHAGSPQGVGGVSPVGQGPGPGVGGTSPGPGAGGAPSGVCDVCTTMTGNAFCPGQLSACNNDSACSNLAQCSRNLGCLSLPTVAAIQQCVVQGCGLQGAQLYQQLVDCALCSVGEPCSSVCPVTNELCGTMPTTEGPGPQGVGGAPQGCFQGSICSIGSGCAMSDPNNPACTISCGCNFQGTYDCNESCVEPVGPQGIGGGPGLCQNGGACSPGTGCGMPDPTDPECFIQCTCFNGSYSCTESCSSPVGIGGSGPTNCSQGQFCQPFTACSTPGPGPECETDCNCTNQGFYSCSTACGSAGGSGGAPPQECTQCVSSSISDPSCDGQLLQCKNDPACESFLDCGANAGCLGQTDFLDCAVTNGGCGLSSPAAGQEAAALAQCGACQCIGICPIDPTGCGISDGPGFGPGGGSGPEACGSCALSAMQQDVCPMQETLCEQTAGCTGLEQCWINNGCFQTSDPVGCGLMTCPASVLSQSALTQLVQCTESSSCCGLCTNVPCTGEGGVGTGGTTGTTTCDQCVNDSAQKGECPKEGNACAQSPDCQTFEQCASGCGNDPNGTCAAACEMKLPLGFKLYEDYLYCLGCETCGAECGAELGQFCSQPEP